jgi:hypothetical protein
LLELVGLEVFCIAKRPQTPKGDSRVNRGRRIAFLSPFIPLKNPPMVEKALLFLLGKKTVGFLFQPLLPKGEDSLRE